MIFQETVRQLSRAKLSLVGGVNSPVRAFKNVGREAVVVSRAQGPHLWDVDGNRYLDFIGSFGPLILGHAHPRVVEAVARAARDGLSYGATCTHEIELAERLQACMPHLERVRFVSSGTEATMSALRLARGATRRNKFVRFSGCYHGHADAFLTQDAGSGVATLGLPGSAGVTEGAAQDTLSVAYNDLAACAQLFVDNPNDIAAVMVEPIACNMGFVPPKEGFLRGLRDLCDQYGAVLIFDEVITGLRIARGGATQVFGVTPDIVTLGKIIGGGMPVGAYGGKKELMEQVAPLGPVYQAGTLSGNPISMRAGCATLDVLSEAGFYERLEHSGQLLEKRMRSVLESYGRPAFFSRQGSIFHLWFAANKKKSPETYDDIKQADISRFSRFFSSLLENQVLIAPSAFEVGFISAAHDEKHIESLVDAASTAFQALQDNEDS